METVSKASSMHERSRAAHAAGKKIALVPTMGALHEGHLSLVREARRRGDVVVVSIFVNPTQFGPKEDFSKYPRDLEGDRRLLAELSVDCVFAPPVEEIYPDGFRTFVEVEEWGKRLCGASRPGHFRGVATVVAKLFNLVDPDIAIFGKKDAQQAILVRRMTRDLNLPVEIVICPIVREPDGLALSSRNRYLNAQERRAALVLSHSLHHAESLVRQAETRAAFIREEMERIFKNEPLARLDYIALVNPETLDPVQQIHDGTLIAVAAFVGTTRLIDNWSVGEIF